MPHGFPLPPDATPVHGAGAGGRGPIVDIVERTQDIPESCQWALFLRNHDELALSMVTADERDHLWHHLRAHRRLRLNLGIRRRLAALLNGDRRRSDLMNGLLLSLPGRR